MRYQKGVFGTCPRVLCEHQQLLPIGQSNILGVSPIKLYCPRCQDIYNPQKAKYENIDGAYFGASFAHMFVVNYPLLFIKPKSDFAGTIFGFKMHASSINHPPKLEYSAAKNEAQKIPRPVANFAQAVDYQHIPTRKLIINVPPPKP